MSGADSSMEHGRSKRTTLREARGAFGRTLRVIHRTSGIEPAGSGTRVVGEGWAYFSYDRDGTPHGQWFRTEKEAVDRFLAFSTPIVEIPPK